MPRLLYNTDGREIWFPACAGKTVGGVVAGACGTPAYAERPQRRRWKDGGGVVAERGGLKLGM